MKIKLKDKNIEDNIWIEAFSFDSVKTAFVIDLSVLFFKICFWSDEWWESDNKDILIRYCTAIRMNPPLLHFLKEIVDFILSLSLKIS